MVVQSDKMFLQLYCFTMGEFAMIKQVIGLNRAYLFNYFCFCGRSANPGFYSFALFPRIAPPD